MLPTMLQCVVERVCAPVAKVGGVGQCANPYGVEHDKRDGHLRSIAQGLA